MPISVWALSSLITTWGSPSGLQCQRPRLMKDTAAGGQSGGCADGIQIYYFIHLGGKCAKSQTSFKKASRQQKNTPPLAPNTYRGRQADQERKNELVHNYRKRTKSTEEFTLKNNCFFPPHLFLLLPASPKTTLYGNFWF